MKKILIAISAVLGLAGLASRPVQAQQYGVAPGAGMYNVQAAYAQQPQVYAQQQQMYSQQMMANPYSPAQYPGAMVAPQQTQVAIGEQAPSANPVASGCSWERNSSTRITNAQGDQGPAGRGNSHGA